MLKTTVGIIVIALIAIGIWSYVQNNTMNMNAMAPHQTPTATNASPSMPNDEMTSTSSASATARESGSDESLNQSSLQIDAEMSSLKSDNAKANSYSTTQ